MANYITDLKGRYLPTVFQAFRGDASIGGVETIEVTVDLSQVGAGTTKAALGTQTLAPNSNNGLAAADTIDVAVLPVNFQVLAVQVQIDPTQPTPDVLPPTALTVATFNIGDACVQTADYATAVTPGSYTASATAYATAQAITAAASALPYSAGTRLLPNVGATQVATPYQFVLRLAVNTLTGATYIKQGRFRVRISGIANGV